MYGDEARGVCMVFSKMASERKEKVKNVKYINLRDKEIKALRNVMKELKKENIRFYISTIYENNTLMKPNEFEHEKERRLLIETSKTDGWYINGYNSIITPYIEKNLSFIDNKYEYNFPLKLEKIILGASMPEKQINMCQIKNLMIEKMGQNIEVVVSSKNMYR